MTIYQFAAGLAYAMGLSNHALGNVARPWEIVKTYVFSQSSHFSPIDNAADQPQDYLGVGAMLVALGITDAPGLELVGNIITTTDSAGNAGRSTTNVLDLWPN